MYKEMHPYAWAFSYLHLQFTAALLYYDDNYINIDAYTVSALGQCKHKTL